MREDAELLTAWRAGDRDAGDELLSRHFDAVFRFFRSKVSDGCEDLAQRTFLDCVEARDRVRPDGFRAYLFGVARNRLVDFLRQNLRARDHVDILSYSVEDLGTSPSEAVARNEDERRLLRAMQRLSLDLQITLELTYWEGMSGREVAEILGIPSDTVRSRLARARDMLRAALDEVCDSPRDVASSLRVLEAR